jgi:UDPglucose--hexose-1-phosphate uridylyltransferase
MADGRELIYFDDPPAAPGIPLRSHRLDDPRPLPDRFAPDPDGIPPVGPEMRYDVLTGDWIPMASHRMDRTFQPASDACPLCPARTGATYQDGEIPDTEYDVVVFENRFPSFLRLPCDGLNDEWPLDGEKLWPVRHANGRCEVVCFSQVHDASVADLPERRIRTIVEAWIDRTMALEAMDGIAHVYCFENRGPEIGVTLPHPHGQIYGYPTLAPRAAALVRQAAAYRDRTGGRALLRDVLDAELRAGQRIVLESDHFAAYVPAAARWPVEVHLAPRRDMASLPDLTPVERADLTRVYRRLMRGLDRFYQAADGAIIKLPYVAGWHQAPTDPALRPLGRLHLQVLSTRRAPDKLKHLAGSEAGMGAWISDTTPELIAQRLREALAEVES